VSETPAFTAHNIELPNLGPTIPGQPLLADSPLVRSALRSLEIAFASDGLAGKSIVDLGCLEGGYTVEFARAGMAATGLEVRDVNFAKCRLVADHLGLSNLKFVQDDVRNVEQYGPVDAVWCSGLLYHLDRPTEFLHLLGKITTRVLLLQTHYATSRRPPLWRTYPPHRYSRLVRHEGNLGRWVREYGDRTEQDKVEGAVWASYGNPRSFWIEKRHLIETLRQAGFPTVYEQYDFLTNVATDPYIDKHHRSLFVAIK
jgi:SAM-dependent methyltransferase